MWDMIRDAIEGPTKTWDHSLNARTLVAFGGGRWWRSEQRHWGADTYSNCTTEGAAATVPRGALKAKKMPARNGQQYIQGLKERPPSLYMKGEKVKDPTTHPGLSNGVKTLGRLYDLQHDPRAGAEMTYASPSSGAQVGLSFITPKSAEDLEVRHRMMRRWAQVSCGMMGRSPDFLNVSLMAMAEAGDYFGEDRPEFKQNIRNYYEKVREEDLVLTHTLVNLQRSRVPTETVTPDPDRGLHDNTDIALSVVKETDAGIVVHGARLLATLPIADEIAVYPARSHRLPTGAPGRTSFAFAFPVTLRD